MRSVASIMNERGIDNIIVVGLVYDFCVKETAIFATEAKEAGVLKKQPKVTVIADLTRPAFDGKPGAPYNSAACPTVGYGSSFCEEGFGTTALHEQVLKDFEADNVGVRVIRMSSCLSSI